MKFLVLNQDAAADIGPKDRNWDSADQDWFFIQDGVWYVSEGTIWDGATLVPDGPDDPMNPGYPQLWLASLIHDLGYMFMSDIDFPYTRKEIDDIFKKLMDDAGFRFSLVYYLGVRWFGGIWNFVFNIYRRMAKRERELPAHLNDYTDTEISIYKGCENENR